MPPTESPRVSISDATPARRSFECSDRALARPVAGEEQPAPPHHEHDFDGEGSRHQQPMNSGETLLGPATQRPSMIHNGNQRRVARLTEKNQYDMEKASTWTPTQLAFSPHRPVRSHRRLPRAQAHHDAPDGDGQRPPPWRSSRRGTPRPTTDDWGTRQAGRRESCSRRTARARSARVPSRSSARDTRPSSSR